MNLDSLSILWIDHMIGFESERDGFLACRSIYGYDRLGFQIFNLETLIYFCYGFLILFQDLGLFMLDLLNW